eukprot:COSAG04_NODE_2280_length_4398_cov_1.501279_2_plen_206_part_00
MPAGVYMFGANEIWRSVDSGATFQHYTTVTNEHWRNNSTDDFFEQTGTPFLAKSGHLIHVPRIGINPRWDETDGSQLFRSSPDGRHFSCMTNAAGDFCTRNNADPKRPFTCEGGVGAYACSSSKVSFGGPGDMYLLRAISMSTPTRLGHFSPISPPPFPRFFAVPSVLAPRFRKPASTKTRKNGPQRSKNGGSKDPINRLLTRST